MISEPHPRTRLPFQLAFTVLFTGHVGSLGCYNHGLPPTPTPPPPVYAWPESATQVYGWVVDGQKVGQEHLKWERTGPAAARLTVVGHQAMPLAIKTRVELELERHAPRFLRVELEAEGVQLEAEAIVSEEGLQLTRTAFGRTDRRSVGYGPGTVLDVGTPLAHLWWVWLLDDMPGQEPETVRAIQVRPPDLSARVVLWELRRSDSAVILNGPGSEQVRWKAESAWPRRIEHRTGTDRPPLIRIRLDPHPSELLPGEPAGSGP